MKADQERVSNLLTDTVTLLCRNGLQYKNEMKVQGLLGITLDDEVFLVQIDKKFSDLIGGDLMSLQVEGDLDNQDQSEESGSDGRTSPSRRKRKRTKRKRSKSDSVESDSQLSSRVKSEPQQEEEEDDLVMIESDSKVGLHDKDTMRESYGVSFNNDLLQSNPSGDLLQSINSSVGNSNSSFLGNNQNANQAGCSNWDDPLSALTDPTNSAVTQGGSSSGGDDTVDQQTMSTTGSHSGSMWYNPEYRRGKLPYDYVCTEEKCGKRFNYKQNLLRHQTMKHGRVPTKPMTWSSDSWHPQMETASNPDSASFLGHETSIADPQASTMSDGSSERDRPVVQSGEDIDSVPPLGMDDATGLTGTYTQQGKIADRKDDSCEPGEKTTENKDVTLDNPRRASTTEKEVSSSRFSYSNKDDHSLDEPSPLPRVPNKDAVVERVAYEDVQVKQEQDQPDYAKGYGVDTNQDTVSDSQRERHHFPKGMSGYFDREAAKSTIGLWEARPMNPSGNIQGQFDPNRGNIYKCDLCDKSYSLKHNLQRHQTTKHGRKGRQTFGSVWL